MSNPVPDNPDSQNSNDGEIPPVEREEVLQWLERLRSSDRSLYNLMALEVWSIAQTMDSLIPGFWNRFMENRQLALQEFLSQRQTAKQSSLDNLEKSPSEEEQDGMIEGNDNE